MFHRRRRRRSPLRAVVFALLGTAAGCLWARPWRSRPAPSPMLDGILPRAEFRDTIAVRVRASPEATMAALRAVTLADMPLAAALGRLRYLPGSRTGAARPPVMDAPFLDGLVHGGGSTILATTDRELVIGVAGTLHNLADQRMVPLADAEAFRVFDAPGYEKLAMSMRVEEVGPDDCLLVMEHRTKALGLRARMLFSLYWLLIKPGGAFVTHLMYRAARVRAEHSTEGEVAP